MAIFSSLQRRNSSLLAHSILFIFIWIVVVCSFALSGIIRYGNNQTETNYAVAGHRVRTVSRQRGYSKHSRLSPNVLSLLNIILARIVIPSTTASLMPTYSAHTQQTVSYRDHAESTPKNPRLAASHTRVWRNPSRLGCICISVVAAQADQIR